MNKYPRYAEQERGAIQPGAYNFSDGLFVVAAHVKKHASPSLC